MEVQWDQDEAHTCDAPRPEYWISFDTKEEAVIELLERLLHEQT